MHGNKIPKIPVSQQVKAQYTIKNRYKKGYKINLKFVSFHKMKNNLFINSIEKFINNEGLEYAGYMAYLNIFSIFPMFIILVMIASSLGETQAGGQALDYVMNLIPGYALDVIGPQAQKLKEGPSFGMMSFVFIGILWTATSTLEGLRTIFNKMYYVKTTRFFIVNRILSLLQFLLAIVLLVLTIATFIVFPSLVVHIESIFSIKFPNIESSYLHLIHTAIIITLIIATTYYSLTSKKIPFASVLPGAIITVVLWFISGELLSYYMKNLQSFDVVYGSLTGSIIILFFFYIINLSLLYGAQVNAVLLQRKQSQT